MSWEHEQVELPLTCVLEMLIWQLPTHDSEFQYSILCVTGILLYVSCSSQLYGIGYYYHHLHFTDEKTEAQRVSIIQYKQADSRDVYTKLPWDSKFPESTENVLLLQHLLSWT